VMLLLARVGVGALVQPRQADRVVAATRALSGVRDTPRRNTPGLSWLLSGYDLLVMAVGSMRARPRSCAADGRV
jgi:hypothetical protein